MTSLQGLRERRLANEDKIDGSKGDHAADADQKAWLGIVRMAMYTCLVLSLLITFFAFMVGPGFYPYVATVE